MHSATIHRWEAGATARANERDRAAHAERRRQARLPMPPWLRQLRQRKHSATIIAQHRRSAGLQLAHDRWVVVLTNIASIEHQVVTAEILQDLALVTIGERFAPTIANALLGELTGRRKRLLSAKACGDLLALTAIEREGLSIRGIDAADEPAADRRRRLARERQRKRRSAARLPGVQRPKPSNGVSAPWDAAGVSRATWYRREKTARETGAVTRPLLEI